MCHFTYWIVFTYRKTQASNAISKNAASGFGLIILLIVIAIAVAILIFNNRELAGFEYLTEEAFVIDSEVRSYLENMRDVFKPVHTRNLIIGTCLSKLQMSYSRLN